MVQPGGEMLTSECFVVLKDSHCTASCSSRSLMCSLFMSHYIYIGTNKFQGRIFRFLKSLKIVVTEHLNEPLTLFSESPFECRNTPKYNSDITFPSRGEATLWWWWCGCEGCGGAGREGVGQRVFCSTRPRLTTSLWHLASASICVQW